MPPRIRPQVRNRGCSRGRPQLVRVDAELEVHDDSISSKTSERGIEFEIAFLVDEVADRIIKTFQYYSWRGQGR